MYDGNNKHQLRDAATGDDWTDAFTKPGFREPLDPLYQSYKGALPKGVAACSKGTFTQSIKDAGFGITKTAPAGDYEKTAEEVFGIALRNEEKEADTDNPFTNDMGPNKGPGSIFQMLLAHQPLKSVAKTTVAAEVIVPAAAVDHEAMRQVNFDSANFGSSTADELSEVVPPTDAEAAAAQVNDLSTF